MDNTSKLKTGAICIAGVMAAAIFFAAGYIIGKNTPSVHEAQAVEAISMPEPPEEPKYYELSLGGNMLCLYEIDGDEKVMIAGEHISPGIFPENDRRELEKGIRFEELSKAQTAFEDFIS